MSSGRKRAFDENEALEAAMEIFWQKGYTGASLSDLTQSMGINKPSLYSTFGNKEALFVKATQRYISNMASVHAGYLSEADTPLKTRLKNYMRSVVATQCEQATPKGCYIVLCESELVSGNLPKKASDLLAEAGASIQTHLIQFFQQDPEAQALGLSDKADEVAFCLATTLRGTASMARAEVPLSKLEAVIDHSLRGIGI